MKLQCSVSCGGEGWQVGSSGASGPQVLGVGGDISKVSSLGLEHDLVGQKHESSCK